jgi:hypothetical protein
MNYGFRISANGVDVKTGADKDMVVTSKYSMLKGSISGSGSISVPQSGSTQTITISHGLGHIPMVQAQWNDQNGIAFNPYFYMFGCYLFNGLQEAYFKVTADSSNIYLDLSVNDFGEGGGNITFRYTYNIFIDKGKL